MCSYSHNTKDIPCKYFHVRGLCENKEHCLYVLYLIIIYRYSHKEMNQNELSKFMADHEKFIIDTKLKSGKTKIDKEFNLYLESKKNIQSISITNGQMYQQSVINNNMNINYNTMLQYAQTVSIFKSLYQTYPFYPQQQNVPQIINGEFVITNGIPMKQYEQMNNSVNVVDKSNPNNVNNLISLTAQDKAMNNEMKVVCDDPRKRIIKK